MCAEGKISPTWPDAATRPDEAARDRMLKAVSRLRDIAQGDLSPVIKRVKRVLSKRELIELPDVTPRMVDNYERYAANPALAVMLNVARGESRDCPSIAAILRLTRY